MEQQPQHEERITLSKEETSILSALKGRTLQAIGALQLMVYKDYIWADTLCLFLGEPYAPGPWDPQKSFVTFTFEDPFPTQREHVITLLHVQQGIAASDIPFDQKYLVPGPCSEICHQVRDFKIREISIIEASLTYKIEREPSASVAKIRAETGALFTSEAGERFAVLAEQSGDLHYIPEVAIANLFKAPNADQMNHYTLGLSRVI
jgi:hypothetical protein